MYGCESWRRLSAEELTLLNCGVGEDSWRVPWTKRRSNQSILKEISPEYSLEGLMLKLKLQYFGHLMQRTHSLEKTLMLGKIEGRRGQQRMRWLDGITHSAGVGASSRSWWWTGKPGVLQSMGLQRVRHDWVTELNTASSRNSSLAFQLSPSPSASLKAYSPEWRWGWRQSGNPGSLIVIVASKGFLGFGSFWEMWELIISASGISEAGRSIPEKGSPNKKPQKANGFS